MPKFPKTFGRRKSAANQLEYSAESQAEHSFKVFERSDREGSSFDGGAKFAKAATSSPALLHVEEDNMFDHLATGKNRGSGASNTNTISTTDNSSRLSAASTAPSSTDLHAYNDWQSPHDKPFTDIPLPPVPRTSSGFSMRNAGRAMSWGRRKAPSPNVETQSPTASKESTEDEKPSSRARAVTASSSSTAVPPKLDDDNLGLSLGGDFSEMFAGFGKRKSVTLDQVTNKSSRGPDALLSNTNNRPNPINVDRNKEVESSPYSWGSQHSGEGLMSSVSPPPFAPKDSPPPPPVPKHEASRTLTASPSSFARPQKASTPDNGLKRGSGLTAPRRQSTFGDGEAVDEDARLLRESVNASRQMNQPGYSERVRDSWAVPSTRNYKVDDATLSSWATGSRETAPRAKKPEPKVSDDNMFDRQFAASAQLAQQFTERSFAPTKPQGPQPKVMTPQQFERYRQDQERMRSLGGKAADDEDEDETYDDEEDDAEKAKQLAKQRRKQEAHMAVYRQQMMKVTGETPGSSSRPSMFASQSSPNLMNLGKPEENEEEDEEVPLAILQAHGFPSKSKPPMRSVGSNPNLRSSTPSVAGGVVDSKLPVFARNLPQDPYYGASVVNPSYRESMAFSGGSPSVAGGPSRGLPPGGLVGVIATEERSRAMRRGSPGPNGEYPSVVPPPSNGFNGMGGAPMGAMGGMNPMMMTPGDQAQIQMNQQMQQFMHMQMQFMQMMTNPGQQHSQSNGHTSHHSMQLPRPGSAQHPRSSTALELNVAPLMAQRASSYTPSNYGGGGYAPSIAPSERSNVGLPGRYRPVSQMPAPDRNSTVMSGGLQNWEKQNGNSTIKTVKPERIVVTVEDEDDEEGWEEMAKKREKKKSMWRTKKDKDGSGGSGLKDMFHGLS